MSFGDFLVGTGKVLKAPSTFIKSGGINGRMFPNGEDGLNSYGRMLKTITAHGKGVNEIVGDLFIKVGENP